MYGLVVPPQCQTLISQIQKKLYITVAKVSKRLAFCLYFNSRSRFRRRDLRLQVVQKGRIGWNLGDLQECNLHLTDRAVDGPQLASLFCPPPSGHSQSVKFIAAPVISIPKGNSLHAIVTTDDGRVHSPSFLCVFVFSAAAGEGEMPRLVWP